MSYDDFEQMIKPFLDLAKSKGWVWNSAGDSWIQVPTPSIALYHKDTLPTTKDGEYKGQPAPLEKDAVASRAITYRDKLATKNADVIMNPEYDDYGGAAYFSSKDKSILDAIKSALSSTMDVATDIKEVSSEFTTGKDFEPQKYFTMTLKKKEAKPQQESLDIDAVVNEALAKVRKKEQTNELFGFGAPSAKVGDKIVIRYDKEIMQKDRRGIILEYIGGEKCKIIDYSIQKFDVDMGAKSNYDGSIFLYKGMTINVGDEQAVGKSFKINNASGPKINQIKLNDKEVKKVKFK